MSAPKMSAVALALGVAVLAASPASAREKIAEVDGVAEAVPARQSAASTVEPVALPVVANALALETAQSVPVVAAEDASAIPPAERISVGDVAEAAVLAADDARVEVAKITDAVAVAFASPVDEERPKDAAELAEAEVAVASVPRFEMYHPAFLTRAWVVQRMGLDAEGRGDAAEADRLFDRYMGMMERATAAADAVDGGGEE